MEMTPAQKKELDTWVIKRDAILRSIATLSTQEEGLKKSNLVWAESNTDLEGRINLAKGRLKELDERELERSKLVSKEVSDLEARKATLLAEIPPIEKEIGALKAQKSVLFELVTGIKSVYDKVVENMGGLEKIVESVSRVSGQNISELKGIFDGLKKNVQEIIDLNTKNAKTSQEVMAKLPSIILEVQKPREIIRPVLNKKRLAKAGEIE